MKRKIIAIAAAAVLSVSLAGCGADREEGSSKVNADVSGEKESSADSSERTDTKTKKDMFDVEPIVNAYHSGDRSGLDDLQLQILDKASQVYADVVTDDMNDYEKELALHDYLIANCTYDSGALRAISRPSKNSDNPYGALINGEAICKGYTTTFSLFMGMAEIPCEIIHSTDTDGDEHAWNVVQLDGSPYYVDCTWDDPVPDFDGRLITHTYFNVSKEFMKNQHVLKDSDPETPSNRYSYFNQQAVEISSIDELRGEIEAAFARGADSAPVIFTDPAVINNMVEIKGFYAFALGGSELERILNDIMGDRPMMQRIPVEETERGTVYCFEFMEFAN